MKGQTFSTVSLLLGDQLHIGHSWFAETNSKTLFVLMEVRQETNYVRHHIQKVVAFFLAMRSFAEQLKQDGHAVQYLTLDDPRNEQDIAKNLRRTITKTGATHFCYQMPDEFRLDQQLRAFASELSISVKVSDTEHFLSTRTELADHFRGKKTFVMESFYRAMRKKHLILLDAEGLPEGGSWNYDTENRRNLPPGIIVPPPPMFPRQVNYLVDLLRRMQVSTIGTIDQESFPWPVTRAECLALLKHFCDRLLPHFGSYQDAMHQDHLFLFHSRLSFALNVKLLTPKEVIDAAVQAWRAGRDQISLPQIEGFVRQILGWREYMRGVYWARMPEFETLNYFQHRGELPGYFWNADTKMNCLHHAISQSLDHAYAHHIQRLMITGNFALLAGVHPDAVDAWYLGIYIDAIQWVEITNTRGMSQYADGGIVGTKPYVASANYINKMSNYCKSCFYEREKRHGDRACPFNSLYWNFYDRHRKKLQGNPRIGHAYLILDKMDGDEREKVLRQAKQYLKNIERL